jgi:succinyl-CoA synthetase beta subunit
MMLKTPQTGPEGQEVRSVLIADAVDIAKEYYLGITLDRGRNQTVIMASTEGGVEIEKVAEETPEKILKEWVDPLIGLQGFQARRLAFGLGFEGKAFKQAVGFIMKLHKAYEASDCSIAEINPLTLTDQGDVLAVDAKINIDDNALYRHKELAALRDVHEEDPFELEAGEHGLNYVKLDGNVGCMVNGAGLAMATMDIIKLAGGEPANFLDVGGGANPDTVAAGFRIILKDPEVKAILVNIFGGIVRCDRVANGVVEAAKRVDINLPLIVRLQGTNAAEGKAILDESGLEVQTAILFQEAADKVQSALGA